MSTTNRTKTILDIMVDRFLAWPLPDSVCADSVATQPGHRNRTGTNLLTADEARQMLDHVTRASEVYRAAAICPEAWPPPPEVQEELTPDKPAAGGDSGMG